LDFGQDAILLIDKDEGITSFDTVNRLKRITGSRRAGHSGTLDMFASGLLVVCTGQATKLARFFLEDRKRYIGTVRLGIRMDTDDRTGNIIERADPSRITERDIRDAASRFVGELRQKPPRFSALKIKGKRASDMVRKGQAVDLADRNVTVYHLEVTGFDADTMGFDIDVTCSKGTYIRSLARDIGELLGPGAYLESLRRLESGHFLVENAVTLGELELLLRGTGGDRRFISSPVDALRGYSRCTVKNDVRVKVRNGANFEHGDVVNMSHGDKKTCIILDEDQNIIAIADIDIEKWQIEYLNTFHGENWPALRDNEK
jgi:tRNA pseudouridine55 synthase